MTSRELTSGFDFRSCGHLHLTALHLPTKFGAYSFIQSGYIDVFRNSRWRGIGTGNKNRKRKITRLTSSNECQGGKGVVVNDYKRYFNQIWHRMINMPECAKFVSKMAAAAILNFGKRQGHDNIQRQITRLIVSRV